jgi:hypothetical protein
VQARNEKDTASGMAHALRGEATDEMLQAFSPSDAIQFVRVT